MSKRTTAAVAAFFILSGWTLPLNNDIKNMDWLIGTWENKTQRGTIFETWKKLSEVELSGKSYILKDKDTIVLETIQLLQEQNNLFYIPKVKNQNDEAPVRFAAKIASDKELVVENPSHDFPQIISYTRISADSLVASIAGTKNGIERKQTFPMKRVK